MMNATFRCGGLRSKGITNKGFSMTVKNVVLISSDHHRFDYVGYRGADFVCTPHLDRMAANGTTINQFYGTTPVCMPCRISISSGRYPMNTGAYTNRQNYPMEIPTFMQQLQKARIHTTLIGKLHHHVHGFDHDFIAHEPEVKALGFDEVHETSGKQGCSEVGCYCRYAEYLEERGVLADYRRWTGRFGENNALRDDADPFPFEDIDTQDEYITRKSVEKIAMLNPEDGFYLQIGLVGPHPQFDAPHKYREFYQNVTPPGFAADAAPQEVERWRAFAACVTQIDDCVGRILTALEERGLMKNTVVMYVSDHGEMAGDRGLWGKIVFYEPSVHVPFIAMGADIPRGVERNALAETLDLGTTICSLFGVNNHHWDQGVDLLPLITGEKTSVRDDVFAEMGSDKMLFDGRYKLMYGDLTKDTRQHWLNPPFNGPAFGRPVNIKPDVVSLYDLQTDPGETHDLSGDTVLLNHMKTRLLDRLIMNMQVGPDQPDNVL
jgi:arylsulfatase